MAAHKLTPWFPPHKKPTRPGVYRTRYFSVIYSYSGYTYSFSLWDGENWRVGRLTKEAAAHVELRSDIQNREWRGILKD